LFHEGIDGIVAVDAYNGRELWRFDLRGVLRAYDGDELMGAAGTGSNVCLYGDSLYVRDGARCLRLDAATGRQLAEFSTPRGPDGWAENWGYLAAVDGVLFGSVANSQHVVTYRFRDTTGDMTQLLTESQSLFAMDARTGRLLWQYPARHSIRHNAIAVSNGRVFLIDRPLALFDREKRPERREHPTGLLLALDAKTGQTVWQRDDDIYGTLLAASDQHGVLLMSYQPTRFRLDSELGQRLAAFRAADGERLWDREAQYASRPLINGDKVYAQGGAWNLLTGESVPFNFQRSYGCGILAASKNLMVFRSATLGYFDYQRSEFENYGGIRPGCWVNAIPAGGVVLMPDASSGCRCSYLNQAWIALMAARPSSPNATQLPHPQHP
jgi:outer membrane protein assembly factor BamB